MTYIGGVLIEPYVWRLCPEPVCRLKRKDWVLMPKGKSPVHSDAEHDVAVQGYSFFQVIEG
jgi:hypothetical protein